MLVSEKRVLVIRKKSVSIREKVLVSEKRVSAIRKKSVSIRKRSVSI